MASDFSIASNVVGVMAGNVTAFAPMGFYFVTRAQALLLAGHVVLNIVVAVLVAPIDAILLFHIFPHSDEAKTKSFECVSE